MPERIICATGNTIEIIEEGGSTTVSCRFIDQYCSNYEKIVKRHAWKSEGFGAQFRMEQSAMLSGQTKQLYDTARITGLAITGEGSMLYCAMVGDSSGIFKRTIANAATESEGHILHERDMLFQDIALSSDGRMAFSVVNGIGDQHIAVGPVGSPHYREITDGDSIDRNPFWDPENSDLILFDSAPLAYRHNGSRFAMPRAIMQVDMANSELGVILESDKFDFLSPQIDGEGNVWCIRRPYKNARSRTSPVEILLIPYKIGRAIFRAIETFTVKNTGEPLITSGSNPSKARPAPKKLLFEGADIDTARNARKNRKSGDSFPGYIPGNWQLIAIDRDSEMTVKAKGVCAFTLLPDGSFIYSNGKYLFRSESGKASKIAEATLPAKIVAG